jgi:hypothetical protein
MFLLSKAKIERKTQISFDRFNYSTTIYGNKAPTSQKATKSWNNKKDSYRVQYLTAMAKREQKPSTTNLIVLPPLEHHLNGCKFHEECLTVFFPHGICISITFIRHSFSLKEPYLVSCSACSVCT